ncbi:MAG: DNRLRE domain-containing protein, partial [Gammaproteobacteria bacterium]|nr:DNRLRE domain-containing protein [Gammaproteobacteria bacterium]
MRPDLQSTRGFILIPVAVAIAIIGVLAFYSANQSAMNVNSTNREVEATRAELVAQAGLQHGLRQAAHQGCGPYSDLTSVNFGADQYGTSLTNDLGPTNFYTVPTDQDNWIRSDRLMNNYGSDNTLQVRFENGNIERPMFRYDLSAIPANSPVISARAFFYVSSSFPEGPVDIHRISADWAEDTATYGNMGDEIDALVINSIPAQPSANIWVEVNLTSQVQAWVNGQPNFGITLNSTIEGTRGDFASQESSNASYIEVVTGTAPSPNAVLKSVGTLANGLKRTILRTDVTLQQNPLSLVHLQPDASAGQDAEIWDQSPNNNYGNADETWVSSANNDKTRTLLRFNMGQVPYGAKILGATLSLERRSGQGANLPVAAHRITNPWIEDEVTWNRRENGVNWNSSGADFENSAVSTTLIGSANIRYEWEIDSLVQGWVDGTFPNYGVILVPAVAGMTGERFHTSDHTDSTHWPSLSITYTCECGTVCMGPQTKASSGRIIMIGNWGGPTPNPVDLGKETLIESWGYEVDHVDDDYIWTVNFNDYDLIYVSETVRAGDVSGQIEWRSIGIVNEEGDLHDNIGFSAAEAYDIGSTVEIVDNSHFITAPFANGYLSIYNGDMELLYGGGALGSGMQALANVGGIASLMVLNTGAIGLNGAAAGKRVALPVGRYGDSGFDWKHLNANGHLLIQRSIEWAMGGGSFS